jgi:ADP-heptose:LPS heptosyltransferase
MSRPGTLTERGAVRAADLLLAPLGWLPRRQRPVRRILLLRLERIGDLLMALEAIEDVRAAWPDATIDLAVGSWNVSLARLIPGIRIVHDLDVPWLSRGERPTSWPDILRRARSWRSHQYDMVLNFEPDIRSHLLAWMSRAPIRAGFPEGGGGPLLTITTAYDAARHVSVNARQLVAAAASRAGQPALRQTSAHVGHAPGGARRAGAMLSLPPDAVDEAARRLEGFAGPFIGIHASGGRESKQWHIDRFTAVARQLFDRTHGTIVLTGSAGDRRLTDQLTAALDGLPVVSLAGELDLPATAAALARLGVFITSDTGPMHLAAAMDVPIVALFGPSDPVRYGPRASREYILRVDLPCSPCGRVRLPPARCRGHVPDCMDGISVDAVVTAAMAVLAR